MNTISTSLLVAACIFAGGIGGLYLHRVLPREHLTKETLDVIKLGTGMLSVLASLVLGLLIATAKTSHDFTDLAIRNYAAELALLNEALRDYGGPAAVSRDLLREYIEAFKLQGWPPDGKRPLIVEDEKTRVLLEQVRELIRATEAGRRRATCAAGRGGRHPHGPAAPALATDRAAGAERAGCGPGGAGVVDHRDFYELWTECAA